MEYLSISEACLTMGMMTMIFFFWCPEYLIMFLPAKWWDYMAIVMELDDSEKRRVKEIG